MKILKISKPIVILLLTIALVSCKKDDEPQIPSVVTASAVNITSESATCGGQIKSNGGEEIIEKGICIGTTPKPTTAEGKMVSEETSDIFEFNIDRLNGSTKYYVRAFATNKIGTAYGAEVRFTTNAPILPTLATTEAQSVSYRSARLGVEVTSDGGAPVTENGICYSTNESPTIASNKIALGTGVSVISQIISVFQANTKYYVRAYATNSEGTAYGEQISFTTLAAVAPKISNFYALRTGITKASGTCNIYSDGGADITERGVCYSHIFSPPTTDNSKVIVTGTTGEFIWNLSQLGYTSYQVRAYAKNSIGITYSEVITVQTMSPTVTDIENTTYDLIEIGNQIWFKQNLKTTKYKNGDVIGTTTADITNETSPKYQWPATGIEHNAQTFGRLYTYYAITDSRALCPDGWRIANDTDWNTLVSFLGDASVVGGKLKSFINWKSPNIGVTDEVGFSAFGSGLRKADGTFEGFDTEAGWWIYGAETSSTAAQIRDVTNSGADIKKEDRNKNIGYTVRCMRNY